MSASGQGRPGCDTAFLSSTSCVRHLNHPRAGQSVSRAVSITFAPDLKARLRLVRRGRAKLPPALLANRAKRRIYVDAFST
jgi:hypothetical protein